MNKIDWKRYWCPFGTPVATDGAFVTSPIFNGLYQPNADLVETASLPRSGVCILLGEAGLGKSTELKQSCDNSTGIQIVDLGGFSSEDRLERSLGEEMKSLPEHGLLILDGLDEVLIEMSKAGDVILGFLQKNKGNVNLWISCRTGAWPTTLTGRIREIFNPDPDTDLVREFELCMLRRKDVELAVSSLDDTESFWKKLRATGAESLAAKPTTLGMLLSLSENDKFPSTRVELYEQGLLKLCTQAPIRSDRSSRGHSAQEWFAVAERVAGRLFLSGHASLAKSGEHGNESEVVCQQDLVGGYANIPHQDSLLISEEVIQTVVGHTALFSGRTSGINGFAHKSYGEYLAARYLCNALKKPQRDSLLYVLVGGVRRIVPQLNEIAAWVADMDSDFRKQLLKEEPSVLLRSDMSVQPASERTELATALLNAVESGSVYRIEDTLDLSGFGGQRYSTMRQLLERLSCSEMANAIRPWLTNKALNVRTRETAITIAWFTNTVELSPELLAIATDKDEHQGLRQEAGYAISEMGAGKQKKGLISLLDEGVDDPDDQLRGIALRALWPDCLTPIKLLEYLVPRKATNFHGSYAGFLSGLKEMSFIPNDDLPNAIQWASSIDVHRGFGSDIGGIAGLIAYEAWVRMDQADVIDELSDLALKRVKEHQALLRLPDPNSESVWESQKNSAVYALIKSDSSRRRKLLTACLFKLKDPSKSFQFIGIGSDLTLALSEDFEWAMEQACTLSGEQAIAMAHLARRLCTYVDVGPMRNREHLEMWLEMREGSKAIRDVLDWPLSIEIGSKEASEMKEDWLKEEEWKQRSQQHKQKCSKAISDRADLIEKLIDRALVDDIRFVPKLLYELLVDEKLQIQNIDDLTQSPGWAKATQEQQADILECCLRYLIDCPLPNKKGVEEEEALLPGWAARALLLIQTIDEKMLDKIDTQRLAELTPFVVRGVSNLFSPGKQTLRVVDYVLQRNSEVTRKAIILDIQNCSSQQHATCILESMESVDETLGEMVLEGLRNGLSLKPIGSALLMWSIKKGVSGAFKDACSVLEKKPRGNTGWDEFSSIIRAIATESANNSWPVLYKQAEKSRKRARRVLAGIQSSRGRYANDNEFHSELEDEALADLLFLLFKHYDPKSDEEHSESGVASTEGDVRRWRHSVLRELVGRGTPASVEHLREMSRKFPEHEWLSSHVLDAMGQQAKSEWNPPKAIELLKMEEQAKSRLIRSGDELLSVLSDSLIRWNKDKRENDLIRLMWNEIRKGIWKPKDEEDLSQELMGWLRTDLRNHQVVIGRELQFSRRTSKDGVAGTRVDISVDAISPDPQVDPVKAIVEVKGSWNKGAKGAMKSQLVDRYFVEDRVNNGLYVVGWYEAPGWESSDGRRTSSPWKKMDIAIADLSSQASRLQIGHPEYCVSSLVLDCTLT